MMGPPLIKLRWRAWFASPLALALCLGAALLPGHAPTASAASASATPPVQATMPSIPAGTQLNALSCPSSRSCWALGVGAVALHWHGKQWTAMPLSLPLMSIQALACASDRDCLAVGVGLNPPLPETAIHWNGRAWSAVAVPYPTGYDPRVRGGAVSLSAVACVARTDCWAAGDYLANTGPGHGLWFNQILHWNGATWSQAAAPQPKRPQEGSRAARPWLSLACAGPRLCWAAGQYVPGHGATPHGLMLRWDGTRWSTVTSSTGIFTTALRSVTCPSATRCVAVGGWQDVRPRALLWNGKTWRAVSSTAIDALHSPGAITSGSSVSCASATDCWVLANWYGAGF